MNVCVYTYRAYRDDMVDCAPRATYVLAVKAPMPSSQPRSSSQVERYLTILEELGLSHAQARTVLRVQEPKPKNSNPFQAQVHAVELLGAFRATWGIYPKPYLRFQKQQVHMYIHFTSEPLG